MIKLLRFLQPYWLAVVALLILVGIQVAANLALPDYTAKIINQGIAQADTDFILHNGGLMLLVSLLGGAATIAVGFFAARIATGMARDIRHAVFARIESFSLAEFNTFSTASLITRTTNDIQQVQQVVFMILRMVVAAPIMAIGAITKAYQTAPSMTWIMGLSIGVLLAVIITIFIIAVPKFQLVQALIDRLNLVTRENLTGLRVIRAFTNEAYEER